MQKLICDSFSPKKKHFPTIHKESQSKPDLSQTNHRLFKISSSIPSILKPIKFDQSDIDNSGDIPACSRNKSM